MDQKDMQEKIKDMSPEELREFQKQQCIFCHIVSCKVPSKKIYEDEKCLAILDINPANIGHILLLPKEHYMIMPQVPEEIMGHISIIAKKLSNICLRVFQCQGTNIFIANGLIAGQKAQHFMIHIIPRFDDDNLNFHLPENKIPEKQLIQIKDLLRKKISTLMEYIAEEKALDTNDDKRDDEYINKKIDLIEKEVEETEKILEKLSGKKSEEESKKTKKNSKDINLDDIAKLFN